MQKVHLNLKCEYNHYWFYTMNLNLTLGIEKEKTEMINSRGHVT